MFSFWWMMPKGPHIFPPNICSPPKRYHYQRNHFRFFPLSSHEGLTSKQYVCQSPKLPCTIWVSKTLSLPQTWMTEIDQTSDNRQLVVIYWIQIQDEFNKATIPCLLQRYYPDCKTSTRIEPANLMVNPSKTWTPHTHEHWGSYLDSPQGDLSSPE